MNSVGFIGLGNVGGKLCGSLIRNGLNVQVYDLDENLIAAKVADGAIHGQTPARMMQACDAVITCLPSPAASASVLGQMLPYVGPGKIWLEMSTTDEAEVKRIGADVIAAGGSAVDCPVSGGCHRADTGNISIYAGCDRDTFDRILPLLTVMGRRVLHTGDLGTASVLKVMTNYLATANLLTLCEALTVMKAAGMDLGTTFEAIQISSGTSFVHETESQLILSGSRDVNFTMDLVQKDIGLFQKLADIHQIPLEISPLLIEMSHIPACYEYAEKPEEESSHAYGQRMADALEEELLRQCKTLLEQLQPAAGGSDEPESAGQEYAKVRVATKFN